MVPSDIPLNSFVLPVRLQTKNKTAFLGSQGLLTPSNSNQKVQGRWTPPINLLLWPLQKPHVVKHDTFMPEINLLKFSSAMLVQFLEN